MSLSEDEHRFPCEECGGMVDLSAVITVSLWETDGSHVETQMTEWEARDLLREEGIPPPPVICDKHERIEIVMEALA